MKSLEVKIGQSLFIINRFEPFTALEIFGDLQKEIMPAAGGALGAIFSIKTDADGRDEKALIEAFCEMSSVLGGKALAAWKGRLFDPDVISVEIGGEEAVKLNARQCERAFEDFTQILELMFHIIRWNFAGPLVQWLARIGLDLGQLASWSESFGKTLSKK